MKLHPIREAHSSYSESVQATQTNKYPTFRLLSTLADCRALWHRFCLHFRLSKFVALHVHSLPYAKEMKLHSIREAHSSYSEDVQAKQTNKQMSNLLAFIDFSWLSCALTLILFAIPPVKVCRIACSIISSCLSARLSHPSFCGQNTNKHKYVSDSFMPLMIRILTLMPPPPHNFCIEKLFVICQNVFVTSDAGYFLPSF